MCSSDLNRMERVENVKSVEEYIARIDEMIERKEKEFEMHSRMEE